VSYELDFYSIQYPLADVKIGAKPPEIHIHSNNMHEGRHESSNTL